VLILRDARRGRARNPVGDIGRHDDHIRLLRHDEFEWRLGRALDAIQDGDTHALLLVEVDGGRAHEVSERLYAQVREHDTLARLANDQFALLLEHCPLAIARERAQGLRAALAFRGGSVSGVRVGIASICNRSHAPSSVIAAAQTACVRINPAGNGYIGEVVLE
jgi:hypothetical protein